MSSRRDGNRHARCVVCGRLRKIHARDACLKCYNASRYRGTLEDLPRTTRSWRETREEYEVLRGAGLTQEVIAQRLRLSPHALRIALRMTKEDER